MQSQAKLLLWQQLVTSLVQVTYLLFRLQELACRPPSSCQIFIVASTSNLRTHGRVKLCYGLQKIQIQEDIRLFGISECMHTTCALRTASCCRKRGSRRCRHSHSRCNGRSGSKARVAGSPGQQRWQWHVTHYQLHHPQRPCADAAPRTVSRLKHTRTGILLSIAACVAAVLSAMIGRRGRCRCRSTVSNTLKTGFVRQIIRVMVQNGLDMPGDACYL